MKKTATGAVQEWSIAVLPGASPNSPAKILVTQGQRGGKKQTYEETISQGKNLGKKNETTPLEQAYAEAEAEWTKKRDRRHYAETVEESAEKRSIAPMLAQVFEKHYKKVDWRNAYGQPKFDGNRCLAFCEEDQVTLWSRQGKPIVTAEHIVEELQGVMKEGDVFDGELYIHGVPLNTLRSFITRKQPESEKLELRVYDFMSDDPFIDRWGTLLKRHFSKGQSAVQRVESIRISTEEDLMKFQSDCIAQGYEGAMLRWGEAGYAAGKRSDSLLKVKTFMDGEFKIINVNEGKGTFAGMAVFECITKSGNRFNVTAPGTLEEKKHYWRHRQNCLGRWLTVKYQFMTKTDQPVPFLPVALSIRDE